MEIRTGSINFPSIRGNGPQQRTSAIRFPRDVVKATAAINGYNAGFAQSGGDHHVGNLQIKLDTAIDGNLVNVTATFGVRDWSGTWDDDYEGVIQFTVFAELISATATPPRGDLLVVDMEYTQAIQHFRSHLHLDPANVRPDNSIRMVARKDTGIRVYVDYDTTSGLPLINQLGGELTVISGANIQVLAPFTTIQPRRDSQIQRALVDHTLNFVIPEGLCQGLVTLRCQVFDQANPSSRSSVTERTIQFIERTQLNIYAVGIHYTGQSLDLAAPIITDIAPMLEYTELTFPVPEAFISGYTEIEFSEDMNADIADGCGSAYNSLLGKLRDLRGDSDDLYYGFLPVGYNGGSVGGCGNNGVGASPFDDFVAIAHEAGHALGRKHAPCDSSSRCNNPSNQDGDFPKYNGFGSDSIGEFGYKVIDNQVFDPINSFDFMGYSRGNNQWVSPYTYYALFSALPSTEGIETEGFASNNKSHVKQNSIKNARKYYGEWQPVQTMKLMLDISIDRNQQVTSKHAFHFMTAQANDHGYGSSYYAELLDENGAKITCQNLITSTQRCNCCSSCYPKTFFQSIPFSTKATKLIIHNCDEIIYEEQIPAPTQLTLESEYNEKEECFLIEWKAMLNDKKEMWYIVHWQDSKGTWRGLSPRTQGTNAKIPKHLFGKKRTLNIRVLASSGIATGVVETRLELKSSNKQVADIVLVSEPKDNNKISSLLRAKIIKERGENLQQIECIWYNEQNIEMQRGKTIHLSKLSQGQHLIRAVIFDSIGGKHEKSWLIERKADTFYLLNSTKPSKLIQNK